MLSFVGKHLRFLAKSFPYLVKYVENKVSISTTHKKRERERERGAKAISIFKSINFKGYAEDFQGILKISKKVYEVIFLCIKVFYILKVYSIHYTLK